jgi:predicted GNAT family N-acyltransferase
VIHQNFYRLGRLAVASTSQGRRLDALLLGDAISRIRRVALDVGGVFILVDAKPDAVGFYRQYGFEPMSDHPLKLLMLL